MNVPYSGAERESLEFLFTSEFTGFKLFLLEIIGFSLSNV